MLTIVQLADGCYKVTVEFKTDNVHIVRNWIFAETESNAEPVNGGEVIRLEFKHDVRENK